MPRNENQGPVTHHINSRNVYVPYFSGREDGKEVKLDEFLEQVTNYLNTKRHLNEDERLKEAKSFLCLDKGDIFPYTLMEEYKRITTFDGLCTYLREIYQPNIKKDLVQSLLAIERANDADVNDYNNFASNSKMRYDAFIRQITPTSVWTDQAGHMTPVNVGQLLFLTGFLKRMPRQIVDSFNHTWGPNDGLKEITDLVRTHAHKFPDISFTMKALPQPTSAVQVSGSTTAKSTRNHSGFRSPSRYQNVRSPSYNYYARNKSIICFNCGVMGHPQSKCWSKPKCPNHGNAHRYIECPQINKTRSPTPPHFRRQSPSPNRGGYSNQGQGYGHVGHMSRSANRSSNASRRYSQNPHNFRIGSPYRNDP